MIISIVCLLLVAGVAYFHWIQGVFTGAISMALAVVAATLSIGMHESIVTGVLGGKMADFANGIVLCLMFGAIYGIGRVAFDSLVPGNVRVPLYFDKVGGLICGLITGICGVGVFAVAMQSMPLGPSIVGFTRYEFDDDKDVQVAGNNNRQVDARISGILKVDPADGAMPGEDKESGLLMPVDSTVVDFASYQSRAGAFAGGRSLATDHPNLLRELFFQRVGIENAAKRVALNLPGRNDVSLVALYAPTSLVQADGEVKAVRTRTLPPTVTGDAKGGRTLLVARLQPAKGGTDTDSKFRFSTGSIRLVAGGKDYYPIGTMQYVGGTAIMLAARADDYLIGDGKPFDVVFQLATADVAAEGDAGALKVKPDIFLEVKRYGRLDLSGKEIAPALPSTIDSGIDRKNSLKDEINKRISEAAIAPK